MKLFGGLELRGPERLSLRFEGQGRIGVFVPAATPKAIVNKLDSALSRIIKSPETSEQIKRMSSVPVGDSSEPFVAVLRRDFKQ